MNQQFWINLQEQLRILPENLASHLLITVVALAAGLAISLPLGVLLARKPRVRYPAMVIVSLVQTIPSLALLALMVPILASISLLTSREFGWHLSALGFWPTVIALTLYSMLPMVRNTVTGIVGVDPGVTEAARGMGMTSHQLLWRVQLPLAAPVILAGIRTATVWVVGIATLSTPVGQRSLGNFIFSGLQTRNWVMVLVGCIGAALLAILLDLMLAGLEHAWERRRRILTGGFAGALVAVFVLGLTSPSLVRRFSRAPNFAASGHTSQGKNDVPSAQNPIIRIGAKTFTEQYVLADLLEQALRHADLPTQRLQGLGSTVIFDALANKQIDVYVDYSGTIWANYMKRSRSADSKTVLNAVSWWLAKTHGIRCLGALGFENAYALAITRQQATRSRIHTINDLAKFSAHLKIGGDYEFFGRPEWRALRAQYNLHFADQISYDSTFMYQALVHGDVNVISAFSSDGRIKAFDLVTLSDTRHVIPPYDAIILLGPGVANNARVVNALRPLVGAVPVDLMRQANYMVDRTKNKQTVSQAADWLFNRIQSSLKTHGN